MTSDFAGVLLHWYDEVKRDLPWRRHSDPYKIAVSEFMLQQTQIDTVLKFYDPFLNRFPSIQSLAAAPDERVLEAWKGLGYYRRARNLQRMAREVVDNFGGIIPDRYEALLKLPGIGPYTAAAIASIAFGRPHAVVDGNVLRVASRLFSITDPIDRAPSKRLVENRMNELICPRRPGDFNQAVMELGQSICTASRPDCANCPVRHWCASAGKEEAALLPVRSNKLVQKQEKRAVFIIVDDGRIWMRRRPDEGLLGGMWEFPNVEVERAKGMDVKGVPFARLTHRFTHIVWQLELHAVEAVPEDTVVSQIIKSVTSVQPAHVSESGDKEKVDRYEWVPIDQVADKALPTVMQNVWDRASETIPSLFPRDLVRTPQET